MLIAFAILLSFFSPSIAACHEGTPSAVAVRRDIVESHKKLRAIEIVYFADSGKEGDPKDSGSRVRCSLKALRPRLLLHDASKETSHVSWKDYPSRQRAYLKDEQFILELPVNRIYFSGKWEPTQGLPGTLRDEMFFMVTGIWPFDECPAPRPFGHEHSLIDIAGSDQFIISPDLEKIGIHNCVVMKHRSGTDVLWLDAERGYAIVKREIRSERFGSTIARFRADGFREECPGLWIPSRFEHRYFKYNSPIEEERSFTIKYARALITHIAVNSIDKSVFEFHRQPGSLHYLANDLSASPVEAIRGSQSHLGNLAGWINRTSRSKKERGWENTFIFIASMVAGLIGEAILDHKLRK